VYLPLKLLLGEEPLDVILGERLETFGAGDLFEIRRGNEIFKHSLDALEADARFVLASPGDVGWELGQWLAYEAGNAVVGRGVERGGSYSSITRLGAHDALTIRHIRSLLGRSIILEIAGERHCPTPNAAAGVRRRW
jgi:hypothetical protein